MTMASSLHKLKNGSIILLLFLSMACSGAAPSGGDPDESIISDESSGKGSTADTFNAAQVPAASVTIGQLDKFRNEFLVSIPLDIFSTGSAKKETSAQLTSEKALFNSGIADPSFPPSLQGSRITVRVGGTEALAEPVSATDFYRVPFQAVQIPVTRKDLDFEAFLDTPVSVEITSTDGSHRLYSANLSDKQDHSVSLKDQAQCWLPTEKAVALLKEIVHGTCERLQACYPGNSNLTQCEDNLMKESDFGGGLLETSGLEELYQHAPDSTVSFNGLIDGMKSGQYRACNAPLFACLQDLKSRSCDSPDDETASLNHGFSVQASQSAFSNMGSLIEGPCEGIIDVVDFQIAE